MTKEELTKENAIFLLKQVNEILINNNSWLESTHEPLNQAFDMAIKALEKDTPKAPKKSEEPRYGMGYEYYDWYCPTCNKFLAYEGNTKRKYIHHCECGQRLDWEK